MRKKITALTKKCSSCGFDMVFDPDKKSLFCVSCHNKQDIVSKPGLNKHNLNTEDTLLNHENQEWAQEMKTMQCPNCGAHSVLQNFNTSATCPYCNTSLIASNEHFNGLKPDSIIPFQFGKSKAEQLFKEKLKKKWFLPNKFKNSINADEINAYYFPTFVFDAECSTNYTGRLYKNVKSRKENGETETVRKYFHIDGLKETKHENIEIEASTHLSQYELEAIKPYDFKQAENYSDAYVQGYSLEHYSNSAKDSYKKAKSIIKKEIKEIILNKYKHDGVDDFEMDTMFSNEKYSYCVLPLYRINYSYKNTNYSNVMNGQTGSLGGKYPKSGWKISLLVMSILMVVLFPIFAFVVATLVL